MARTRYIKPEFFDSEDVARVSFTARLLFAGLWTLADREGRFELAPRRLKAKLFPYDHDVQIEPLIDELIATSMVVAYEADGRLYAWMPGFQKHQKPHPKETASTIPACPNDAPVVALPWKSRNEPGSIPSSPRITCTVQNGNGDEDKSPPAPARSSLVMSPAQYARLAARNAFVGSRLIVPLDLHADLRGKLGGASTDERLQAWYRDLNTEIDTSGEEITPSVWKWLDGRYQQWRATEATAQRVTMSVRAIDATRAYLDGLTARNQEALASRRG